MTMRKAAVLGILIAVSLASGGCSMSNDNSTETQSQDKVAQRLNGLA
jgi:hypothetical protein